MQAWRADPNSETMDKRYPESPASAALLLERGLESGDGSSLITEEVFSATGWRLFHQAW